MTNCTIHDNDTKRPRGVSKSHSIKSAKNMACTSTNTTTRYAESVSRHTTNMIHLKNTNFFWSTSSFAATQNSLSTHTYMRPHHVANLRGERPATPPTSRSTAQGPAGPEANAPHARGRKPPPQLKASCSEPPQAANSVVCPH